MISLAAATSEIVIRPYEPGDETSINDAFNEIFKQRRSLEEWRWKFQADSRGSEILLAFQGQGELIAHYAACRVVMKVGNSITDAGHVVDSFSHTAYGAPHRKIFIRLANQFFEREASDESAPLLYGFPGTRHLKLGKLKIGYEHIRPVVVHHKAISWLKRLHPRSTTPSVTPTEYDSLWAESANRYDVAAVRDASWIAKRYLSRPGRPYQIVQYRNDGRLQCWAVMRCENKIARWVDTLWNGRHAGDLSELSKSVINAAAAMGAREVVTWIATDHAAAGVLEQGGWQRQSEPDGLHVAMRVRDSRLDPATIIDRYYHTLGDTDIA